MRAEDTVENPRKELEYITVFEARKVLQFFEDHKGAQSYKMTRPNPKGGPLSIFEYFINKDQDKWFAHNDGRLTKVPLINVPLVLSVPDEFTFYTRFKIPSNTKLVEFKAMADQLDVNGLKHHGAIIRELCENVRQLKSIVIENGLEELLKR